MDTIIGKKRKRCVRSCFHCSNSHLKCSDHRPCDRCFRMGKECTDTIKRRRGPKKRRIISEDEASIYLLYMKKDKYLKIN